MLQVKNIKKEYCTGSLIQKALDDVSLNLRDNEFVAILGPSGSGKTTLLNIIGGLDRYDSGDIIINGISTKKYSDRDWDSYRNHTIGFVFQSYNLIPHQTVLANVELALTISGVSKAERRKRATQALEEVGLGEQLHKKPNQMSGGQMQRVAIARALVNNPDILLADEPTGALDSTTSVQVMELLKEVARDRLVVMVTHNPELAKQYATRTVTLRDGHITSDSDPYFPDLSNEVPAVHKNMGKSSMSLLTAFSLSVNNLFTKKARTLLTSFAGSIGIIGIALILALSSGANAYIQAVQEETLSEYPLQIYDTSFSTTALLTIGTSATAEYTDGQVGVISLVTEMFAAMGSNDLSGLKEYLDSGESGIEEYATAIEYIYDITPYIYLETGDSYRQVNPDETFSAMGFGSSSSSSSLISSLMSTDVFYEMPSASALYEDQYTLLAGKWPENYNECIVVLTSTGSMSDLMMYAMGLRDADELDEMVEHFINEEDTDEIEDLGTYTYDDILGITFKLVNSSDFYEYDEEYEVWTDKSDNEAYVAELVADGEDLTIVGIVQPEEDALSAALETGICYSSELVEYLVAEAAKSEIVQQQLADKSINVFTGEEFGSDEDSSFDMDSIFSIDEDAIADAFSFDEDALEDLFNDLDLSDSFDSSEISLDDMDLSSVLDTSSLEDALGSLDLSDSLDLSSIDMSSIDLSSALDLSSLDLSSTTMDISIDADDLPELDLETLLSGMTITLNSTAVNTLATSLMNGFAAYLAQTEFASIGDDISAYLATDAAAAIISAHIAEIVSSNGSITVSVDVMQEMMESLLSGYMTYAAQNGLSSLTSTLTNYSTSDSASSESSSSDSSSSESSDSSSSESSDSSSSESSYSSSSESSESTSSETSDSSTSAESTDSTSSESSDSSTSAESSDSISSESSYSSTLAESTDSASSESSDSSTSAESTDSTSSESSDSTSSTSSSSTSSSTSLLTEYLQSTAAQTIIAQYSTQLFGLSDDITISSDQLSSLTSDLTTGYLTYASENSAADPTELSDYFTAYLATDEATALIQSSASSLIDTDSLETQLQAAMASYMNEVTEAVSKSVEEAVTAQMTAVTASLQTQLEAAMTTAVTEIVTQIMAELSESIETAMTEAMEELAEELEESIETAMTEIMEEVMDEISEQIETAMTEAMEGLGDELADSISDAFSIDEDAFADAFEINLDEDDLTELLVSLSTSSGSSYESNLETLGYVDFDSPSEIDIYPVDFSGKETVMEIIDDYNAALEAAGRDDETVSYTDTVGTLMSSVTTIIDTISYILIAFVAISLVVSSIMIGVITYISVLERRKEIGILRAMGASKGNISSVFNAETFIIGFIAGALGVGISMLLCIPGNYIIHVIANTPDMDMVLEPAPAALLIALSVALTLIGGLIPSRKAAKSDPVTALRTD